MRGLVATEDGGKTWEIKLRDQHFVGLVLSKNRVWAVGSDRNNFCSEHLGAPGRSATRNEGVHTVRAESGPEYCPALGRPKLHVPRL